MQIVLSVNSGSSSLKFQLYNMPSAKVVAKGQIERIGLEDSIFTIKFNGDKLEVIQDIHDHHEAVEILIDKLLSVGVVDRLENIVGVGHRVVHGGEIFSEAVLIDDQVIKDIESLAPLAPLHNPVNLIGIHAFKKLLPDAVQVAVFDTAFHQTMDESVYLYPIPYEYYEKHRIRRYGFHGTSHYYVSRRTGVLMKQNIKDLNVISIHLGNGASITAIENGRSVNTSMGFTPLAGIMMGTRTGDVDPAIMPFLMNKEGLTSDEVLDIFNNKSGMLGISGLSSDARTIIDAYKKGDQRAITTLELYTNRVSEVIGSYYVQLQEVDAIIFTGGIGENAGLIREMILNKISKSMGLSFDKSLNMETVGTETQIATEDSDSEIWIVPTDEELIIAKDTYEFVKR